MTLEVRGGWTNKDVRDMEDNVEQERFEVTDTYARVGHRSSKDNSGWWKHPLTDKLRSKYESIGRTWQQLLEEKNT